MNLYTATAAASATTTAPTGTSFLVFDDRGRVWPPGFVSATCDPDSPHCALSHSEQARERAVRRRQTVGSVRVKTGS